MADIYTTQSEVLAAETSTTTVWNTQGLTLVAYRYPAERLAGSQAEGLVAASPVQNIFTTQAECLVLIKQGTEEHSLRAWTFTQDDHDFYVLQLGNIQTLVYDKRSERWAQWKSPTVNNWRAADGCDWEGFNVACDTQSGKIYKIDPTGRLDYGTTPITSVVVGGLTDRFRKKIPVFMAELAISSGSPPTGIDASTVGITLRTSDTHSWVEHGTITGLPAGERTVARWYGLGLIHSPGVIFELTDTGYARRIDGLDIEIGAAKPDGQ